MSSANAQPLITIGIACYNAGDTVARAVESALAQDWENREIIVVDDKSMDNSVDIVENLAAAHPALRLIRHDTNQGPAAVRQTIIDNAKGGFIAFFDDDDESLPARIKTQYERIISCERETGETLIACYASGKRVYDNGYTVSLNAIGSRPAVPHGTAIADYVLFYGKRPGMFYGAGTPTCALMARKSTFTAAGGFDPAFRRVEDLDFAVRLGLAGGRCIGCPETLFIQHATRGADKSPAKNLEAEIQLAEKHKDYLRSVGRYDYARRWPLVRYHHFTGQHGRMALALLGLFIRAPLKVMRHFFRTAPRRLLHEIRMKKKTL